MKVGAIVLRLVAAAALSCLVVLPFLSFDEGETRPFALEMEFATDTSGYTQLYYDVGASFNETHAHRFAIQASTTPSTVRFPLPAGTFHALRFDPLDRGANVRFGDARIVSESGKVHHQFSPGDFTAVQQITSFERGAADVRLTTAADANDPIVSVTLPGPLTLQDRLPVMKLLSGAVPIFTVLVVLLAVPRLIPVAFRARLSARRKHIANWLIAHPSHAVVLVAALAALLSCYPIVFLGKSFVAPSFSDGTYLLYEQFPTLPNYDEPRTEEARGSDVGAIAWAHQPYSMVQSEALFEHGEIPLWNRYNSSGTVLFGQGQTMFGDPLHVVVLLARGAAWAWDLKYVLARWLLCCGLGLAVLHCTRHLPAALLTALSAAFLGFFVYRVNHPAFFSFCYGPWILYAWLRIVDSITWRGVATWCAVLIVANFAEMHSGTAKEAYMLLLSLNFAGTCVLLGARRHLKEKVIRLAAVAWAGMLFVLLTAPSWITFLGALKQSFSSYNSAAAFQILPVFALGFFDEIFYRPLMRDELVFNPSANFVVLGGLLYVGVAWRFLRRQPHLVPLIAGAVPSALLAFGVIPPRWITQIPFLGNVHHIDNSFSCVLIIIGTVVAGFGWKAAFQRLATSLGWRDLRFAALLYLVLAGMWLAATHTVQRPTFGAGSVVSLLEWGKSLPVTSFVWLSFVLLPAALLLLFWSLRRTLRQQSFDAASVLLLSLSLLPLLWRFGAHSADLRPADFVFSPTKRPDFHAPSEAINAIKADQRDAPARVFGIGGDLFPGWSGAYQLEGISGPDALINPHYRELIEALQVNVIWGWRVYLTPEQVAGAKPALDFLNVRHWVDLHSDPAALTPSLTLVNRADLDVYRSETAWPRAFFTSEVVSYEKPSELATFIREPSAAPFAAMLRADLTSVPLNSVSRPTGAKAHPAREYKLSNTTTQFTVEADKPGVAVLHEAWLPEDFVATLDGAEVPVLRINHAFKGVFIPSAGTHRVAFTFRPRSFSLALGLFGIGTLLSAASLMLAWRRTEKARAVFGGA